MRIPRVRLATAVLLGLIWTMLPAQSSPDPHTIPSAGGHSGFNPRYVFFFDVSGSMNEPGKLRAANSPTRQYLAEHLFADPDMFHEGQPASIYSFTTACQHLFSGPLRYSTVKSMLLTGLPVGHENTNLVETLRTAQAEHQQHANNAVTLAWILTDNVNDPAGTGPDEINTRSFYGEMFREDSWAQRMYFFPLKDFKLVLYLLVFAPDATLHGTDIDAFEDGLARFARALGAPKIRAKPVGGERPLELAGITSTDEGIMSEVIGSGSRGSLKITGLKEGKPINARFRLHLRSRFDEWRVEDAKIELVSLQDVKSDDFSNVSRKMPAHLSPRDITVDPRAQTGKIYTLDLGDAEQEPPQSPFFTPAAFNPDGHGLVNGNLVLRIGDPRLTLKIFNDPATTEAIQSVFRLKDIEYFVPKAASGKAMRLDLMIPVQFEVGYNALPRWAGLGTFLLVVVGGAVWILAAKRKAVECRLIGYQEDTFKLVPGAAFPIVERGIRIAELRKTVLGKVICRPLAGVILNGRRTAAKIANGGPIELAREGDTYSYRLEMVARRHVAQKQKVTQSGGYY